MAVEEAGHAERRSDTRILFAWGSGCATNGGAAPDTTRRSAGRGVHTSASEADAGEPTAAALAAGVDARLKSPRRAPIGALERRVSARPVVGEHHRTLPQTTTERKSTGEQDDVGDRR